MPITDDDTPPAGWTRRRALNAAFTTAIAAACAPRAWAAPPAWPTKPVRLIFPFAVGGSGAFVAQEVADRLARQIGGPTYVDSLPGANGNIGVATAAKAAPDGHTLLITSSSIVLSPALYPNPGYHLADLVPVGSVADIPFGLVVHPSVPATNLAEFTEWLRKRDGNATYASAGNGNMTFLTMHLLLTKLGLKATHVPYKGGAPAIMAVLSGEPQFTIADLQVTKSFVETGKLRLLAVTGATRSPQAPNVPTIAEAGVAGYAADGWMGMFAPAKTPPAIVQQVASALAATSNDASYGEKLMGQGLKPRVTAPGQSFGDFVTAESSRWGEVIRASGARID
jgi:tripartite-type tricarboxylate transporter receptor subunit TctC